VDDHATGDGPKDQRAGNQDRSDHAQTNEDALHHVIRTTNAGRGRNGRLRSHDLEVARAEAPVSADQSCLVGDDHRLHPVAHAQLVEDVGHVRFHGRLADV